MGSKYPNVRHVRAKNLVLCPGLRVVDGLLLKEWDGQAWLVLGVACNRDYHDYPVVVG